MSQKFPSLDDGWDPDKTFIVGGPVNEFGEPVYHGTEIAPKIRTEAIKQKIDVMYRALKRSGGVAKVVYVNPNDVDESQAAEVGKLFGLEVVRSAVVLCGQAILTQKKIDLDSLLL